MRKLRKILIRDAIYLLLKQRCGLNLFAQKMLMRYQFFFDVRYFLLFRL